MEKAVRYKTQWTLSSWAVASALLLTMDVDAGARLDRTDAIQQFLTTSEARLTKYEAVRTLTAEARGGSMHARLTAMTSLDPERGFEYSVIDEEGSGVIRKHVLHAALEAEQRIVARREGERGALTVDNYDFDAAAGAVPDEAGDLVRIAMHPRRRDTMLVDGAIYLSAADGDLVRVEGLLVKRPSFWTRRVEVGRHYARVAGVRVPIRLQSKANVLVAGTSTFTMTYEYRSINGQRVDGTD